MDETSRGSARDATTHDFLIRRSCRAKLPAVIRVSSKKEWRRPNATLQMLMEDVVAERKLTWVFRRGSGTGRPRHAWQ